MNRTARRILAKPFSGGKIVLPSHKKSHVDRFIQRRRARGAHIAPQGPKRQGWRRFYHANYSHKSLEGMRRAQKRSMLKRWYKDEKRAKREATD